MSTTKVLLIVGWDRSGSTILANVLGSTPGVVTLGEVNNVWDRGFGRDMACGCGKPFSRCEFWAPIATTAFGEDQARVSERGRHAMARLGNTMIIKDRVTIRGRLDSAAAGSYRQLLQPLYQAAADQTDARLLIDASKTPWHAAVAEGIPGVEPYILHLVRDPRGVASSLRKRIPYEDRGGDAMDSHGLSRSSLIWLYRGSLIEAEWGRSAHAMRMRYEDFVADPVHRIAQILRWVGIADAMPTFIGDRRVQLSVVHNVSGNPVRFARGPVELRVDDGWKTDLTRWERRYVNLLTWPLLRRFGYEGSPSEPRSPDSGL